MAAQRHNSICASPQTPAGDVLDDLHRRFAFSVCRTAADVVARAERVRDWRSRQWPTRPPVVLPVPTPAARPAALAARMAIAANDNMGAAAVPGRITVRQVLEATAAHFAGLDSRLVMRQRRPWRGTTVAELLSDNRTQPLVRRRQIAAYVAHRVTGRSLVFIGKKIGGRDHTTILHARRVIAGLLDAGCVETAAAVKAIVEKIGGAA